MTDLPKKQTKLTKLTEKPMVQLWLFEYNYSGLVSVMHIYVTKKENDTCIHIHTYTNTYKQPQ